ncbi:alpha/beta fold hydrolase [uncultured Cellulomonas sp.]|uniref:alpha/beta fold hydrolase n=1 Tax=uncultured Cellulomonas sp. TaxID=189682 RepID=UPI002626F1F3|nr:alpha/beta hydrolase [uncultured Cellulomonas sp.]
MATFVLVHGGGDVGWYWHLVDPELRARGHEVVAPDLPCDDDTATLSDYADAVLDAVGDRPDLVVVGQSYGGFTAALVAARAPADALVFVAGMIPVPGERPADWWTTAGFREAVASQAQKDGGLTGHGDPLVAYYHDVPRSLAEEAMGRSRGESSAAYDDPWPLDALPSVPTHCVIGAEDRFLPAPLQRRLAADRLGVVPDELPAGHCVALSRPRELAELLDGYARAVTRVP